MNQYSEKEIDNFIQIFEKRKALKDTLGGCPPTEHRVNPECFHCDECWIASLNNYKNKKFSKV